MDKSILRKDIKVAKSQLSAAERRSAADSIKRRIETSELFVLAQNILLYHSLPDEVDTHRWIEDWCKTKTLFLPVVVGDTLEVRAYLGDNLHAGAYSIYEPTGEKLHDLSILDLVIVPGVAFDRRHNRLGRGKGFYDRLLREISAPTIGVAYNCQIATQIPVEAHDIALSHIFTPDAIY